MLVAIIISVFSSIISGMVLFFLQRFFKRKAKKDEARDAAKAKENMLILKSIDAVGKLTYANAVAIRDGRTNGEMHEAMEIKPKCTSICSNKMQKSKGGWTWKVIWNLSASLR